MNAALFLEQHGHALPSAVDKADQVLLCDSVGTVVPSDNGIVSGFSKTFLLYIGALLMKMAFALESNMPHVIIFLLFRVIFGKFVVAVYPNLLLLVHFSGWGKVGIGSRKKFM